eukprot:12425887-Karenia_brevis.AAC.1
MHGEKAIACVVLSRFSDEYYGQWLVLNVPWRDLTEFFHPKLDLVPNEQRNLAMALLCKHPATAIFDGDDDDFIFEMKAEGRGRKYVNSVLNYLRANRSLITDYLMGKIPRDVPQLAPDG